MPRKVYAAEQVAQLLQQIERAVNRGAMVEHACMDAGISEQTYYRWKVKYAGLKADQIQKLDTLVVENNRLRKLVANLTRDTLQQRHDIKK